MGSACAQSQLAYRRCVVAAVPSARVCVCVFVCVLLADLLLVDVSVRADGVGLAGVYGDEVQVGRDGQQPSGRKAPVAEPAIEQPSAH